jgi:hypothetical protein
MKNKFRFLFVTRVYISDHSNFLCRFTLRTRLARTAVRIHAGQAAMGKPGRKKDIQDSPGQEPDRYLCVAVRSQWNGFLAGQYITLGIPGNNQVREYSIYSTMPDSALEVLIKEVDSGTVSRQLRKLIPGELLDVDGPLVILRLRRKPEQGIPVYRHRYGHSPVP